MFRTLRQVACEIFIVWSRRSDLVEKNYISGHIWHKSFIQTVKSSFFKQIIVNQSFKSLARCLFVKSIPKTLSKKAFRPCWNKIYLQLYWTQIVHSNMQITQIILNQSFYGALLTFGYILNKGKVLCFARFGKPRKSLVRCLLSEAADQTLWKKVIFNTNRSLKR